jgi:hypothetical protein
MTNGFTLATVGGETTPRARTRSPRHTIRVMPQIDDHDSGASAGTPTAQTALPPVGARVLAFVAIVLAGAAGGTIGYAFADLQTTGDASVWTGLGAVIGALIAAGGTAVVVVLTLRAMGEWKTIKSSNPDAIDGRRRTPPPSGGVRQRPRVR